MKLFNKEFKIGFNKCSYETKNTKLDFPNHKIVDISHKILIGKFTVFNSPWYKNANTHSYVFLFFRVVIIERINNG